MKRVMLALLMLGLFSPALVGCSDKTSGTKKEVTKTTPEGSTTTTTESSVEKSGENPPAPAEPAK